ncbi:MAG: response regulator [Adhaeribacter sp.]|jgi:CheY-like chemotaxis protein|nr:response regulator [Adhaeribacter sp.]
MKTFIIDDDNISIYLTKHIIQATAFSKDITSFLSAEDALEVMLKDFPANMPEIIFLDLNMPGMNGWEFLEELAPYKTQLSGHCRIYILTSSLNVSDTTKSENYELVCGLIHKTIDQADLEAIMEQLEEQTK